ncbi:type I restriction endonuclease subunit R [Owenweeksia hongkongensis]|uniref:type I restriction endonuclease subunit R n=1 Tax=Owenweeksia hongkongensis TaxID=253245 RepID=UPI003A91432E
MTKHLEIRFEEQIEHHLLTAGGYEKGNPNGFDSERGLFPQEVLSFIQHSQSKQYEALKQILGNELDETLITTLCKELTVKGSLNVLRHGFKCYGKKLKLAFFAPNTSLNPEASADYRKNKLTLTRQVRHSTKRPHQSIDIVLAVNGLPVVTMELKNAMTGQTVHDAIEQYISDREPTDPIFKFKERALVHFAVDTDLVYMATCLKKDETRFLPFNKGHNQGAGNPAVEGGYRTSYLWEEVLMKDSLMDILARYMHLQVEKKQVVTNKGIINKTRETMIFPRYHQLQAVRKLVAHSRDNGSGHNYLVQHSAGSGKSNSIAWLAHRLASLHNIKNEKIFHSVVVITDRLVLDQQLQDTIYQFEHKQGVVQKIDENTQQLAKALADGVPIIITTIQKFPFIAKALDTLGKKGEDIEIDTVGKRFAVIVDEAHSSQSGETAMELRKVLNKGGIEAAIAEQLMDIDEEELSEEALQGLKESMMKRAKQPNLSFFAFTATPKFKTKAVFNEPGDDGKSPFHLYSMRQAIEEGFIMDVLENYTTYKTYFGLIKSVEDDPEVPKRKAAKALARFISLHPHDITQKVEVIVEHFRTHTKHKIGGRAKAMVVTRSRLHAVKYKQAFDAYLKKKGYNDIKSLVAFSGTVEDPDLPGSSYTEVGMNQGIRERELRDRFASEEYQVLLVADKYQTGFDQPLLHTMYVDKRLSGIQAVQTLSRLNRTITGKEDTFVLDFVNEREEIYKSFKQYFEKTEMGDATDPHQLYQLQHQLENYMVFTEEEVDAFAEVWFKKRSEPTEGDHKKMSGITAKAVDRFKALEEEDQEEFKGQLVSFRNLYSFVSQVIPFQDSDLEKLYTYLRFLNSLLPKRQDSGRYELDDDIKLKYYRLQKISEGKIDLRAGEAEPLYGPTAVGTGNVNEEQERLSILVNRLNDRFGTEFTPADQLFFEQVVKSAVANEKIQEAAKVNSLENFMYLFNKMLEGIFIQRMDGNEEIFTKLMNDGKFKDYAAEQLGKDVYKRLQA